MGQNTSNSVWKPCEDLQKTFDLCHCQQRVYNKVLRWNFVIDQIFIFHHNLQINSLKILQWDFLDVFSYFVSHSWGIPMMKITGLSHLFKWENLHNWWLTKYFFAPLYMARGSLHFVEFNFSRVRRGLVFSWVCTNNACLVCLHLPCDFSVSFFFCPLFTAVVSMEQFFFLLSN